MNREIIERGQTAKRLLESPEWKACLEYLDRDLIAQFRKTNVNEVNEREDIHKVMYWSDLFSDRLSKYVEKAETEVNIYQHKSGA
ncbi:hypothetical protein [Sinorhizobium sp. BG8]|uniref:hypothetical protein n=1 Tax=Sinorhizobium sp. BG8 TaxID=2613773 RepID=UPI00193D3BD5|nr:hypothetical protein [Sinorhizobium sp. BG8]QRM54740.1 hypothetical protein F3Y30_09435 [Sinorhizobium sp. BG8]